MKFDSRYQEDNYYMKKALELAKLGIGAVNPNPLVGCIIDKDGKVIGEGYHMKFGGPHAEVNAINSSKEDIILGSMKEEINKIQRNKQKGC